MLPISDRFQIALMFAAALQAELARVKHGVPYTLHLLDVAASAFERGPNEDEAVVVGVVVGMVWQF